MEAEIPSIGIPAWDLTFISRCERLSTVELEFEGGLTRLGIYFYPAECRVNIPTGNSSSESFVASRIHMKISFRSTLIKQNIILFALFVSYRGCLLIDKRFLLEFRNLEV